MFRKGKLLERPTDITSETSTAEPKPLDRSSPETPDPQVLTISPIEISEQHLSVGIGRDYADVVSPLTGIYSGDGSTALELVVEMNRLA